MYDNKEQLLDAVSAYLNAGCMRDGYQIFVNKPSENGVNIYQSWSIIIADENGEVIHDFPFTTNDELILLQKSQELYQYIDKLPKPLKTMLKKKGVKL